MAGKGTTEISFDERKLIFDFLKIGTTIGAIAISLGRSHSGIKLEISRNGGRYAYDYLKAQQEHDIARKASILKKQKGWLPETIEHVKKLLAEGKSKNAICKGAKVSWHLLSRYIKENRIKISKRNYTSFEERICAIEQQIEIILDLIKEMQNDK